jgi:hypothetical protein
MKSVTIKLPECRSDTATFFSDSGYYAKGSRWNHYPVLAFVPTDGQVEIQVLGSPAQVKQSTLPDSTPCMQQWGGQWRSDFFAFTLGEARAAFR